MTRKRSKVLHPLKSYDSVNVKTVVKQVQFMSLIFAIIVHGFTCAASNVVVVVATSISASSF